MANQLDVDTDGGAAIVAVELDGPADRVRLAPGDVVTAIDDRHVHDGAGLPTQMRRYDLGDTARLTVARTGRADTIDVILSARPPPDSERGPTGWAPPRVRTPV